MKFSQLFFRNNFFDKNNQSLDLIELMKKSCLIHQDASGIYSMLGLGVILQQKIETTIRQKMQDVGFNEMHLSILQDCALWQKTGRIDSYGQELFRLKDRKGHEFCLSATAEELITQIVKDHYQGSKLSLNVFQIGEKYRDELRARGGMTRGKQFIMKDGYSFYSDENEFIQMYQEVKKTYQDIFDHFNLKYEVVSSDNGEIGGKSSEEFLVESQYGEGDRKLLEIAHIFQLGQEYSQKMELHDNLKSFAHMGCYGIGVSRLLTALCEQHRDEFGFWGDDNFSTFETVICAIDYHRNEEVKKMSDELYQKLKRSGIQVLLDDRQENAGKKMTDSELIGIQKRIVISRQAMEKNSFELLIRKGMQKQYISKQQINEMF